MLWDAKLLMLRSKELQLRDIHRYTLPFTQQLKPELLFHLLFKCLFLDPKEEEIHILIKKYGKI